MSFLSGLRRHWDAALTGFCFLVIGLVELSGPNVRPTGRWKLIGGLLWDAYGNAGVAMIWWTIGAMVTTIVFFKRK